MSEQTSDAAYLVGYAAHGAGIKMADNPHPVATEPFRTWCKGWMEAAAALENWAFEEAVDEIEHLRNLLSQVAAMMEAFLPGSAGDLSDCDRADLWNATYDAIQDTLHIEDEDE